jgi:uncharacterized protein YndB with AHSA1/START domain
MVKKILIGLGVVVVAAVVIAAFQPSDFKVERSLVINAAPEAIFPYVNSPKLFDTWNPFAKEDPNIKMSYAGPESGEGAQSSWVGNSHVGEGAMEIVQVVPNQDVRVRLDFKKPMEGSNMAHYSLVPEAGGTKVTWEMTGKNNIVGRIFCTLMGGMDKMVGGQFEKGLNSLKQIVEVKQ